MTMDRIYIKQPDEFKEIDEASLWKKYTKNRASIHKYAFQISEDKYRFWDEAKYKDPADGFTKAESWYLAREVRKISSREIPVRDSSGDDHAHFTWLRLGYTDELLRKIDMHAGGNFLLDTPQSGDSSVRQRYLTKGIMEEAIASSQLEGSNTSSRYAKRMIAENIEPRNKDDWMILNNYNTLKKVEEEFVGSQLSKDLLLEMHVMLTENTLDDPSHVGRYRTDEDGIIVEYGNKIAHVPPEEDFLIEELDRLIKFANDDTRFMHPVIKGLILHFWVGFLHPFCDGNGRLARSLFYWFMLKNDYWAFVYLPISKVIKDAPKQYTYSYIYAEQDNLDFTYFYDFNIKKIIKSIDEFNEYVERMQAENRDIESRLNKVIKLNSRQKQLVHYLVADPSNYSTVSSHRKLNTVSRQTAYRDFQKLEQAGLVRQEKSGRQTQFFADDKLLEICVIGS